MMPNVFMHTYIICIYHIYRTQWSIHMNAICKYDSHPVTQSFTRPALLFTHTAHKSETTKETINRVLLSWIEKLVSTLTLPLCMHFVVLLAFWSIAEQRGRGRGFHQRAGGAPQSAATRNIRNIIWIWLRARQGRASKGIELSNMANNVA